MLSILGGFVGFGLLILGLVNSRNQQFEKARDDRWDETEAQRKAALEQANTALSEAEHLRQRIQEVRAERDELKAQLREAEAKTERRDIRIVQLEARVTQLTQTLATMETKERALRRLLHDQGIPEGEVNDA